MPDLPATEAEVWARVCAMRTECWPRKLTAQIIWNRKFKREFKLARMLLQQDPVTAYATAARAVEQRAKR